MSKTDEIIKLLAKGKTSGQIIKMGYKRGTVYGVQRKWHKGKIKTPVGVNGTSTILPLSTPKTISLMPDIESDPDIFKLKKELRKAELEKQLGIVKAPPDIETLLTSAYALGGKRLAACVYIEEETDLCTVFEWSSADKIPEGIGEPLRTGDKEWRIKPSPLYCAICSAGVEGDIEDLAVCLREVPSRGLREQFTCECGAKGMVALSIKCTKCEKETWWGWWPKEE